MKSESKMKVQVLLFVVIIGCCALENLHGTSFVFSTISETAKVVLKPNIIEPLSEMTACLQSYTENVQRDSLLKMDAGKFKSQFHLYQIADYYNIAIGGVSISFKTSKESMEWRLICVSWESSTGIIHLVVNGKLFPRKVLRPGYIIDSNITVVLGQNLADVGLNFYRGAPSYVGEIRNVHVWDRALNPSEMQSMYYNNCYYCNGSVISWESVDYEIYGDVILYKPSIKP
ncbi:serum amyloid P-component-like isoform X2 [Phyllobates terribilis]|uniref:serum amyloid P-component-like isoform X2 n=1 Tax=Phyllobates terribilis TaxID=111132 RepID=UPI003CCAB524